MKSVFVEREKTGDETLGAEQICSEASIAAAVAELEQLNAAGLRRRWRSLVGLPWPTDLGRALTLRVLSYKLQAQRLGDLDRDSTRQLATMTARRPKALPDVPADPPFSSTKSLAERTPPPFLKLLPPVRPGTTLVRDYGGVQHRVMVLEVGVAWNGKTFDSLSKVAFAITGTRWNGPRFFGLRDKATAEQPRQASPSSSNPENGLDRGQRVSQPASHPSLKSIRP